MSEVLIKRKTIKCPICGETCKPNKKNAKRGYYRGIYLTTCPACGFDIIIKADDIDWETEQ